MINRIFLTFLVAFLGFGAAPPAQAQSGQLQIAQTPLFVGSVVQPHVMLNLSVDSQLFFSAYPEYADLSGDGRPDMGYAHEVDYFGYFDPFKCYSYSTTDNRFVPVSNSETKYCGGDNWSGNFLNWLSMSRLDAVRQILYGGNRHIDTPDLTVLERSYLPNDAHSWVRFYDGEDLNQLSPFSSGPSTVATSTTARRIVAGSRQGAGDRFSLSFPADTWTTNDVYNGDQIEMTNPLLPGAWMRGVVVGKNFGSGNRQITVQITGSNNPTGSTAEIAGWRVENRSRRGVTFCNTTVASGASHGTNAIGAPPLLMVARGDYSLWTANERWQCRWREDITGNAPPDRMWIGGGDFARPFSSGNDVVSSGLWSNSDMPRRNDVRLNEFHVRVEACRPGLEGTERCKEYGDSLKPIGLLQQFGEAGDLRFGLMTGSYTNHISGGVLRKNMGTFGDEVNLNNGTFSLPADSIVRSLDALRIFGYNHGSGEYNAGDENCVFGTSKAQMRNGRCFSWGNPQAEIYAESLRYLAGLDPNPNFTHTGDDRVPGLTAASWNNPIPPERWCTPQTIIQFNSSITSFDDNAPNSVSGLPEIGELSTWTNEVGAGEGLNTLQVFSGGDTGICSSDVLGNLSSFRGICPEAPNQDGTYHIAGLAHYAYTNDLRPTWEGEQTVNTIGVSLAPAVPVIRVPRPGQTSTAVQILPACDNRGDNLRCQLAAFRIVEQDLEAGTGKFFIQWDVSEWGADFDMDINGTLSYKITGSQIEVTTQTWADSSGRSTGFGYIISGTSNDGFFAHSGINSYNRTNPGSVPNCSGCNVAAAPTTGTFSLGGGSATLLREPLYYAAKWGGYKKNMNFPANQDSWDETGDGVPDNYFFAADPAQLFRSLRDAFQQVVDAIETTTLETTSTRLETGTLVFQAGFDTEDWTGEITAIDPFASAGEREKWSASETLEDQSWNDRDVYTAQGGSGITFSSGALPDNLKQRVFQGVANLRQGASCQDEDADQWYCQVDVNQLIDFLRGDRSNSLSQNGFLRDRSSLLGDIVNSQIVVSPSQGRVDEGWGRIDAAYETRVQAKLTRLENNNSTVFVGSNNGKLHAFNATTGAELFAFVPEGVLGNLYQLANPSYQHRYYVDGRISVADAFIPGRGWRTILVGALGAGGKSMFALDVTNPEQFNASTDVLWEIGPNSPGAANLGHIMGAPVITRVADGSQNGTFVAIVGNGYNGDGNAPSLMVIDLATGSVLENDTPMTPTNVTHNGLSAAAVLLDVGTRTHVSRVYAGDLSGRMYAFDFDGSSVVDSRVLFQGSVGSGDNAVAQPITSAPNITTSIEGGLNLYFGTGRFFVEGDELTTTPVQSFYRVRDVGQTSTAGRSDLGVAVISGEVSGSRTITVNDFSDRGWYLDLIGPGGSNPGERVLVRPEVIAGRVIFSTFQPSNDPCAGGGIPRLYVLDAETGGGALGGGEPGAGGIEIPGVGSPLNPPVVISPPSAAEIDPDGNPIPPDQDEDGNPIPPPTPPDGTGFDRSTWCSQIGYLNPLNQQFVPLAALCDGRQVWRQIW